MQYDYRNFYFGISYKEPNKGSYPRVTRSGFYLNISFSDEGNGNYIANDLYLAGPILLKIIAFVSDLISVREPLLAIMQEAVSLARKDKETLLLALRKQQTDLEQRISTIESDLEIP